MSERYLGVCSAPAGSYIILIHETNNAVVLPVVGWVSKVFTRADGSEYLIVDPLISDSAGEPAPGGPESVGPYSDWEWKTFAPGENGLRWVEAWEEETGRKIVNWDVSVWWPSRSPLFAASDDTLWSDDFIPPDERLGE